jgi:hypothetical protein
MPTQIILVFEDVLGSRMETESNGELCEHALLCYICAGNVSKLVDCWSVWLRIEQDR